MNEDTTIDSVDPSVLVAVMMDCFMYWKEIEDLVGNIKK